MYSADPLVWGAFCLYLVMNFVLAWLARRSAAKRPFLEEFFVAGRDMGPWLLGFAWITTAASGGTFIGAPALAHAYGWVLLLWISSYMVFATTGVGLLGKRISEIGRRTGALTFPDLLRDRYDSRAIGISSGLIVIVLYTSFMVAQYIAGARLIEATLGIPYVWSIVLFTAVIVAYTAYGGFRAVAWTDTFQGVLMLAGVLIALPFAIHRAGGLEGIHQKLAAQSPELLGVPGPNDFLPLPAAISFFVVFALAAPGQPSLLSRFLACRNTAALKRASFLIGVYILLLYPAIMSLGVIGRALQPNLRAADHATPAVILSAMPPLLAGLALSAPMAAIMSTVAGFMLVTSSAIVRDLYQRNTVKPLSEQRARRLTQASMVLIAAAAIFFSLRPPPFLQHIVIFSGTGLSAAFLFPTLLSVYWPRMNKAGCLAGILGGFLSFLAQYAIFGTRSFLGLDPFVWSLAISLACAIVVSRLTPPSSKEILLRYFD